VNGAKTDIRVPVWDECHTCHGTGCKPGTGKKTCPHCRGTGTINMSNGFLQVQQTCPHCQGTGEIISDPCPECRGTGRTRSTKTLEIDIPRGIASGQRIRLSGKGEPGRNGGPSGDLYVQIIIKEHEIFEREGDDLHADLPLSFATAALGGEVSVPTMDTETRITIPEGTQSGKVLRLRGKGVPNLRTGQKGDLYVHVYVETPVNLSAKQKKLLREFDETLQENAGKHSPRNQGFMDKMKRFFES
jgi:molecular chaperone DnaJ